MLSSKRLRPHRSFLLFSSNTDTQIYQKKCFLRPKKRKKKPIKNKHENVFSCITPSVWTILHTAPLSIHSLVCDQHDSAPTQAGITLQSVGKKKNIYICAQNTQSQDKQGQQPPSCFPARLMCDFANWLLFTLTKTELENVSLQQPHQAWRAKVTERITAVTARVKS